MSTLSWDPDMSYVYTCDTEKLTSSYVVFMCFRRYRQRLYQAGYNNGRVQLTIGVRLVHAFIEIMYINTNFKI